MTNEYKRWGEVAYEMLRRLRGQHVIKKRRTLLAMADAAYAGESQASVLARPECGSKSAHYKWLDVDPDYKAAYEFLVGDFDEPGLARARRIEEAEAEELRALEMVAKARTKLRLLSGVAVATLQEALEAVQLVGDEGETSPDYPVRLRAADSVLDRVPGTAKNSRISGEDGGPLAVVPVIYLPENGRDVEADDVAGDDDGEG